MRAKRILRNCAFYLGAIWIIAVLPLASVLFEYGHVPLCPGTSLGWFIATLYGSFFIYPVAIGGLAMAALLLPLTAAFFIPKTNRPIYVLLGLYVVTTIIVSALEFYAEPGALFQIRPDAITANPQFLAGLKLACSGDPFPGYQTHLPALIAAGSSITGWFYYPGFIAQALMQNALFWAFVAFVYFRKDEIVQRAPYLRNAVSYLLGYALFLGSIWCMFRLTYRHDMSHLLGVDNPFLGDWAVIFLYFVVLAVFVLYFGLGLEQFAKTISTIFQFAVFILGVGYIQFDQADRFFGAKASGLNIFVLFLLCAFLSALTLAFLLRPAERGGRG